MQLIPYIMLIAGFALLVKGAGWLVDGASSIAKRLRVSDLLIGLTVVAFGTSMPELIVNIFASFGNNADIAIGNILGSNTFNILVILGISTLVYPLSVMVNTVWKEIPLSLLAASLVLIQANDAVIDNAALSGLTRIDGIIMLIFFLFFTIYVINAAKQQRKENVTEEKARFGFGKSVFYTLIGLVFLFIGGKIVVDGAVNIAKLLGVSEALIGLTIVAAGTSLPELATSAVAAYKKNCDIAVGNIVGSNIFNIFFILGVSSVIRPLPFRQELNADILMAILSSLLLFLFMFSGKKKHTLERWEGAVFILIYLAYIGFLVMRG